MATQASNRFIVFCLFRNDTSNYKKPIFLVKRSTQAIAWIVLPTILSLLAHLPLLSAWPNITRPGDFNWGLATRHLFIGSHLGLISVIYWYCNQLFANTKGLKTRYKKPSAIVTGTPKDARNQGPSTVVTGSPQTTALSSKPVQSIKASNSEKESLEVTI